MPGPVFVATLGALTVALDAAVNIAFPAISAAFGVPATSIQWIVLTYMGAFAVALIPAGRLGDRVGHARVFRGGLLLTGATHLLCGVAPTWTWLLGARIAQGLGAALVMASAPALVTLAAVSGRRGRALGLVGLATSLGAVVGPLGGGVLVGALGWRVVYLGRLPLVLLGLGLCRLLPAPGAAFGPDRRDPLAAPPARGTGRLVNRVAFVIANAAHLLSWMALFAVWLLVPYYLIDQRGFPAALGGLLFTIGTLAQACAAPLAGRLADRGAGRWLAPLGLAIESLGLWLTSGLDDVASLARIAVALGLGGFGSGLFIVANMHDVMAALAPSRQGVAGGLVVLMRTAGVVAGASLISAVYAARLAAHAPLGEGSAAAAAFADVFRVAAAIAAAAALVSLLPPPRRAPPRPGAP